jgi:hypothetical protein
VSDDALSGAITNCDVGDPIATPRFVLPHWPGRPTRGAVVRGGAAVVERAARVVEPVGSVYWELTSRMTLGMIDRRLAAAGLARAGVFWLRGGTDGFGVAVPLDEPGPLLWYLRQSVAVDTPVRRAVRPALLAAARAGPRLTVPCVGRLAVTAVLGDGPDGAAARPGALAVENLPAGIAPAGALPLVLARGDVQNRVVTLPFARGSHTPTAVVKSERVAVRNSRTEHEQAFLPTLRASLPPAVRRTLPEPLGLLRWNDVAVGLESHVDGRPLGEVLRRWPRRLRRAEAVLDQVTDWLIEFTLPTAVRVTWAERAGVWVDQPVAAYRRVMSPAAAEAEALDRLRATVADWGVRSVPEVTVHWGLRTQNMFLTDRGISVVDWEGASPGPPLYDLFFFLVEWVGHNGTRQQLSSILCGSEAPDRRGRAVRHAVQRYVDALDLDRAVVPVIYTLLMVECALGRQRRGSAPATPYVAEVRNMLREQSAPSDRVRFRVPP